MNMKNTSDIDRAIDKISKISFWFIMLIVFTVVSVLIVKKLENSNTDDSFFWNMISLLGSFPTTVVATLREALLENNLVIPEQIWNIFSSVGFQIYCFTSTIAVYFVATYIFGVGIIQCAVKILLCPIVSPPIMPIVIIVMIISFIKNCIILIKE